MAEFQLFAFYRGSYPGQYAILRRPGCRMDNPAIHRTAVFHGSLHTVKVRVSKLIKELKFIHRKRGFFRDTVVYTRSVLAIWQNRVTIILVKPL